MDMKYSSYFKSVLFGFLGSCIIFVLTTLYLIGTPTPSAYGAQAFYEIKSSYANSIKIPKILIVAGSNATYGISSRMITEETGIPAANLGTGAGFGAAYSLRLTRPLLKPGDTIVLPLEYEAYGLNPSQSEPLIEYVLAYDHEYLFTHPWLMLFVSRVTLMRGILAKFRTPPRVEVSQFINKSGDAIDNYEEHMTAEQRQRISAIPPIRIKENLNDDALRSIREFARWCRSQNIKLVATWPNTLFFEVYQERSYQNIFQQIESFYKGIGVPILGKYSDFMYDQSMFYDSRYHLNNKGVRIRTKQIIKLLEPYLKHS